MVSKQVYWLYDNKGANKLLIVPPNQVYGQQLSEWSNQLCIGEWSLGTRATYVMR